MSEIKKRGRKKKTLYECVRTFLTQMSERYPDTSDLEDSTVFIIASDGSKVSSLFGGDNDTMKAMISFVTFRDDELRDVVGEGLQSTINLLKSTSNAAQA